MRGLYTNQKRPTEHFGPMLCSCFFSYSYSASRYSYSERSSIAIRPIGPQVPANCLDQRSASLQLEQPSSTSTVSLSTASLSTSTTKSGARHELRCNNGYANKALIRRCWSKWAVATSPLPGWISMSRAKLGSPARWNSFSWVALKNSKIPPEEPPDTAVKVASLRGAVR